MGTKRPTSPPTTKKKIRSQQMQPNFFFCLLNASLNFWRMPTPTTITNTIWAQEAAASSNNNKRKKNVDKLPMACTFQL